MIIGRVNNIKILNIKVKSGDVLDIINARLEAVTTQYNYAVADDRKISAEALAETKWQLAELKIQFVNLICEQIEAQQR